MPHISIQGHQLFYEDRGNGFPLLFGHSYLWDGAMWEPQVAALSARYRCIVPDLWGHGRSDPPPQTPYSIEALAEDFWTLTRSLGLERFAVIGLSVGGMWGIQMALIHPEAVAALVVMDSYVGPEPEENRLRYFGMMDMVEKAGMIPPPIREAVLPLFFSSVTLQQKPDLPARFQSALASIPSDRIPGILTIGRAIFGRSSLLEQLPGLNVPTLIIVGADDRSRPPHEAEEMARRIPGARLEVIPQAGHISNLEQPDRVTALIREFLKATVG
ncbi:MAG: alpha/beta fold hydrolase [Thermoflexales bacterium]|nr:alpha/beta fold hydrolase [Thermoflexales bacterium]